MANEKKAELLARDISIEIDYRYELRKGKIALNQASLAGMIRSAFPSHKTKPTVPDGGK
jgi:hypothetical protein